MTKTTISIHQPAYLPWLGYFDKIINSDIFVFLDTVQYEKNSFINRNQILTKQGPSWLTIPVKTKGHTKCTLQETEIDNTQQWQKKHLKSIELNYRKTPFFETVLDSIKPFYKKEFTYLAEFCFNQLKLWCDYFNISTPIVRSSDLDTQGEKSELVLNICKHFKATHYLSGKLGIDYLELDSFNESGINVEIQNFIPKPYNQVLDTFVPNLSILDYAMNCDSIK